MSTKSYSKGYYNKIKHKKMSGFKKALFKLISSTPFVSRYYFVLNKLILSLNPRFDKKIKVLDIGCAQGGFLNFLKNIRPDFELYGMDISDMKKLLPKNVKFINKNIITDKLPKDKFDLIVSLHLIEHINVSDVPIFFERAKKLLNKNGVLFVLAPRLSQEFYNDPTHIRPYNKESLERLFKMAEFKTFKTFNNDEFNFPFNKLLNSMKLCFGFGIK